MCTPYEPAHMTCLTPPSAIFSAHTEFLDPFTKSLFTDPVLAEDGRTYEREHIEKYIAQKATASEHLISPCTHESMGPVLTPNSELKAAMTEWIAQLKDSAAPAPKVELKSVDELGEIFESLDKLGDILPSSMEAWQMPSFVVLGSESSGKSTLLERVSMFTMFPRSDGICTRMAIKVELRRGAAKPAELQVVDLVTQEPVSEPAIITLEAGERDVRVAMDKAIRAEHSELTGISQTRMLVLRVTSPTVPSLDLVDLPGLVSARTDGEPPDMPEQTRELLDKFIRAHKQHSVFLVVIRAAHSPKAEPVLGLVQEHGIEKQCIGVFTKCDDVSDRVLKKDVRGRLDAKAKDAIPLEPYGWIATMNAPPEDDQDAQTPTQRLETQGHEEVAWFKSRLQSKELSSRLGCNALIQTMKTTFHAYVEETWAPMTLFRLKGESARLRTASALLGLPAAHTELQDGQLKQLQQAAFEAAEHLLDKLMGAQVRSAYQRAADEDSAAATPGTPPETLSALGEWAARRRREVHQMADNAIRSALVGVRDKLAADDSSFKLGRFPAFIEAIGDAIDTMLVNSAEFDGLSMLHKVLKAAVDATPTSGWVEHESCATERRRLDALEAGLQPAMQSVVKLLSRDRGELTVDAIISKAGLNALDLSACRVEGLDPRVRVGTEARFSLVVSGPAKLPWVGKLIAADGRGATVSFEASERGYEGRFTPSLSTIPKAVGSAVECKLQVSVYGLSLLHGPLQVIVEQMGPDDAKAARVTAKQVEEAGFAASDLTGVGFKVADLLAMKYDIRTLKTAGFDEPTLLRDAKAAGLTLQEAKAAGFTLLEAKVAGFTLEQAKAAGFTKEEAKAAGYVLEPPPADAAVQELLRKVGCSLEHAKQAEELDWSRKGLDVQVVAYVMAVNPALRTLKYAAPAFNLT